MNYFGVIADDLTGAMDAGIQMFNKNMVVKVALSIEYLASITEDADCVIVNTQSRNGTSDEAYEKITAVMKQFIKKRCDIIYKKIDSTLRGHIGEELRAVLECEVVDCIIVAPALPFKKRITKNGIHFVNGIQITDTELAKDPFSPISHSAIADIIKEEFNTEIGLVNLETVRKGSQYITKEIDEIMNKGIKIIVVDAVEDSDLQELAKASRQLIGKKILCGSAGLFQYFNEAYNLGQVHSKIEKMQYYKDREAPLLIVSGSPAFMSKKQIKYLSRHRNDIFVINFDITRVDSEKVLCSIEHVKQEVLYNLKKGLHVILDASGEGKEAILENSLGNREKLNFDSSLVQRMISEIIYAAVSQVQLCGLVIFGGDTSVTAADCLGAIGIEIRSQIEPYIAKGKLIGGTFSGMPIVTKAGGFGKEDSLNTIINSFSKGSEVNE